MNATFWEMRPKDAYFHGKPTNYIFSKIDHNLIRSLVCWGDHWSLGSVRWACSATRMSCSCLHTWVSKTNVWSGSLNLPRSTQRMEESSCWSLKQLFKKPTRLDLSWNCFYPTVWFTYLQCRASLQPVYPTVWFTYLQCPVCAMLRRLRKWCLHLL